MSVSRTERAGGTRSGEARAALPPFYYNLIQANVVLAGVRLAIVFADIFEHFPVGNPSRGTRLVNRSARAPGRGVRAGIVNGHLIFERTQRGAGKTLGQM